MKRFKKSDLKCGDVVLYERKITAVIDEKDLSFINENYDEMLRSPSGKLKIIAVYRDPLWEREELKITNDEKTILSNLDPDFKYISRDKNNVLYVYKYKPNKTIWTWEETRYDVLNVFNHLFAMVKWEDEEPWAIEELLKLPVKEDK